MKHLYILLTVFLFYQSAKANHVSGADITYKCLGGNTYQITLEFYRDCAGVAGVGGCNLTFGSNCSSIGGASCSGGSPNPVYFSYYSASCGYCVTDSFTTSSAVVTVVSPLCPSAVSSCSGGTVAGMQKWTFTKTITLPSQCSDWTFIYGCFARNVSLTTIQNATGTGFAVYSTLNNLAAPCNSSPSFVAPNITYLCAGHPYCFNEGTTEPNGDSLVYTLVQPRSGVFPNSYITYNAGYSYTNPFGNGSPITFNTATGEICVTPAAILVTDVAVKVSEYRNSTLIGTVERDMEFVVINCNNDPPVVSGINGATYASNNTDSICAGSSLCFNVNGSDPNTGDTLTMTWDNAISGATFNVTGNNNFTPAGQFCWTPSLSNIQNAPYVFNVQIHDNACPYEGVQYFPYYIYVKNCSACVLNANFTASDAAFCNETGKCISFTDHSTCNPTSWHWMFQGATPDTSSKQNPDSICYYTPGTYAVTLIAGNSGGADTLAVPSMIIYGTTPVPPNVTTHGDTVFSSHGSSYQWYFNGSPITGATDSFYVASQSGTYSVNVTNNLGCASNSSGVVIAVSVNELSIEQTIKIYPNPAANELIIDNGQLTTGNQLSIYNVFGEKFFSSVPEFLNGKQRTAIDIRNFSSGIYFVKIVNDKFNWVGKFVKE